MGARKLETWPIFILHKILMVSLADPGRRRAERLLKGQWRREGAGAGARGDAGGRRPGRAGDAAPDLAEACLQRGVSFSPAPPGLVSSVRLRRRESGGEEGAKLGFFKKGKRARSCERPKPRPWGRGEGEGEGNGGRTPPAGWPGNRALGRPPLRSPLRVRRGRKFLGVLDAPVLSGLGGWGGASKARGASSFPFPHDQTAAPPPWAPAGTLAEQS